MQIKDKLKFKIELKRKIDLYIKQFPIYFYGNIFINLILIGIFSFAVFLIVLEIKAPLGYAGYSAALILSIFPVFLITIRNFFRNMHILNDIRRGSYEFGIEDHEMDNAVEFIEDLPMKREEVERMKVALSYGKIIDVLEAVDIISCNKGMCDMDVIFKYDAEFAMDIEYGDKISQKK